MKRRRILMGAAWGVAAMLCIQLASLGGFVIAANVCGRFERICSKDSVAESLFFVPSAALLITTPITMLAEQSVLSHNRRHPSIEGPCSDPQDPQFGELCGIHNLWLYLLTEAGNAAVWAAGGAGIAALRSRTRRVR